MAQTKLPSFLLAAWLLGTIATKSGVEEFLQTLQDYEIVRPRILSGASARARRSTVEHEGDSLGEPLLIEISNWTIRTTLNDRLLLSSNLTVEFVRSSGERRADHDVTLDCELRRGSLEGGPKSLVVLTLCETEIYALMFVERKSIFVQPLVDGQHVMYKVDGSKWRSTMRDRSTVCLAKDDRAGKATECGTAEETTLPRRSRRESTSRHTPEYYNLSGDVFDMEYPEAERLILYDDKEEPDEGAVVTEDSPPETESERVSYFSNPSWQRNKYLKKKTVIKDASPRWLELGIAADYSVVEFHGSRVQQYILALLNIVSAIYMDPSLESNMVLVVVRMILYAEKRDGMVRRGDARRSLENVNRWNRKMLALADVRHDVAVWLTRLDIGGPSGYAPVAGVCDPSRSCALNRDEGLTSAFIIAHEIAHVLGLTHDGDGATGNTCGEEASRGSVMAPMVAATFHHFYWSACSRKEFHRRVRRWSCLLNRPSDDSSTQLRATVRESFTMDEQCRMEFGEGYELCKTLDVTRPCSNLWCGNTNISQTCKTKKGPPLDGTLCGDSKWCINGRCESTSSKRYELGIALHQPRDGGWSAWSAWEKCSRTCGVGVQCRSRRCNKPSPAHGGKYCSGQNDDCRLCQLPKCSTIVDLRAQQCSRLSSSIYDNAHLRSNLTWLAYASNEEKSQCQLICRSKETGEIFYTRRNLIDGTPCSYGTTNICIQGECHQMGCDNVLGSEKVLDTCGVCDGDDSNCDNVISKFQRKLRRDVSRVAVISRRAHHFSMNITIVQPTTFHRDNLSVVVGDGRRRQNVEESLTSNKRDLSIVQGAAFSTRKFSNDTYTVRANGSNFEDVVILLVIPRDILKKGVVVNVSLRYSINREEQRAKGRYVWLFGGWSFCSSSCGGGTRQKMIVCKDEKTGRIVSRRKCPITTKPNQAIEKCNTFSCSFKWLPSRWEECSTTCGSSGIQLRQLYCVYSEFNGTEVDKSNELQVYQIMVRPSTCKSKQAPASSRECNRIPCPGHWMYTDWSSCSKSHGKGIQSRIARCIAPDGESLFHCDGPSIRTEIRPCNGHVTRAVEFPAMCWRDRSQFCSLPTLLRRYCDIPGFRRKCCRTCESYGA